MKWGSSGLLFYCLGLWLIVAGGCAPAIASIGMPSLAPSAIAAASPPARPLVDGTASATPSLPPAERDDALYVIADALHQGVLAYHQEPVAVVGAGFKPTPTSISRGKEATRGMATQKQVALTFDCSAWVPRETVEDILNTLERAGVRVTFFVTGQFIERYPDLFQRVAEWHELGNHSYSHPNFLSLSPEQQQWELQRTEELVRAWGYTTRPLWRAPFGARNPEVISIAAEAGWPFHIFWSLQRIDGRWVSGDSQDWREVSPQQVERNVLEAIEQLGAGTIVVQHGGSSATAKALPAILAAIEERGYAIVPVSALLPGEASGR